MKKLKKNLRYVGIIVVCILIYMLIDGKYGFGDRVKVLEKESVTEHTEKETIGTQYGTLKDSSFICTNEEIKLKNLSNNTILWNQKINIQNRIYKKTKDKVIVASKYGYKIFLFNEKGKIVEFNTQHPIVDIELNNNGYMGVVQEDGDKNLITVYDNKAKKIIERITYINKSGRIMCCALSEDNKYLTIAYLRANGNSINSDIEFLNIKDEDLIDNIYATKTYRDRIIYKVGYHNGDKLFALSDKEIYDIDILKDVTRNKLLEGNINMFSLAESENKLVGVLSNKLDATKESLVVYDMSTLKAKKVEIKEQVTYFRYDKGNIIINQKNMIYCFNLNGEIVWKIKSPQPFSEILFVNQNKIMVVSGNQDIVYNVR